MREISVPVETLQTLLVNVAIAEAHWLLTHGAADNDWLHPGDSFGKVVAWTWTTDPLLALGLITDYMAQLRYHDERAPETNRITLDQVLNGLPMAIADAWLPRDEVKKLVAYMAEKVPPRFSDDINQP